MQQPMRGARPKAVRCPIEGHPSCEIAKSGAPPGRSVEKREWMAEAIEVLTQPSEVIETDDSNWLSECTRCSKSRDARTMILSPAYDYFCTDCSDLAFTVMDSFWSEVDMEDPFIHVV